MSLVLGAIADDFTGATDLANNLARAGMRCAQLIGVPEGALDVGDADAALKSGNFGGEDFFTRAFAVLDDLTGEEGGA